jgi:hypothetical protein
MYATRVNQLSIDYSYSKNMFKTFNPPPVSSPAARGRTAIVACSKTKVGDCAF